jgi:uncharacterized protein
LKFQPDTLDGVNAITRFDGTRLWVGAQPHGSHVLVPWRGAVQPWAVPGTVQALEAAHFQAVLALRPELVILGSGARQQFVAPRHLAALLQQGIGVEAMDSAAACRTYNVLAAEGRQVVAAVLLHGPEGPA